jgi:DNA-binding XRE family transcriptional regulator
LIAVANRAAEVYQQWHLRCCSEVDFRLCWRVGLTRVDFCQIDCESGHRHQQIAEGKCSLAEYPDGLRRIVALDEDSKAAALVASELPPKPCESLVFPARLRAVRDARGLTQVGLAFKAKLARRAVQLYEHGQRRPFPATLDKLAVALGVSVEALTT